MRYPRTNLAALAASMSMPAVDVETRTNPAWEPPYFEFQENYRRTGRTTRMVEKAIELAQTGVTVYVVCADRPQAERLAQGYYAQLRDAGVQDRVKFESAPSMGTMLDERNLKLLGVPRDCIPLFDHAFLEQRVQRAMNFIHAFDAPPEAPDPDWEREERD